MNVNKKTGPEQTKNNLLNFYINCVTINEILLQSERVAQILKLCCESINANHRDFCIVELGIHKNVVHFIVQTSPEISMDEVISELKDTIIRGLNFDFQQIRKKSHFWGKKTLATTLSSDQAQTMDLKNIEPSYQVLYKQKPNSGSNWYL